MTTNKPSVSAVLDSRYSLQNGKFAIKIRVTFTISVNGKKKWVPKYYPTGQEATLEEFESIKGNPRISELKDIKKEIARHEAKANEIIDKDPFISVATFETRFMETGYLETVEGYFDRTINALKKDNRIGTESLYRTAKNSFIEYGGKNLTFRDIDTAWLKSYEKEMTSRECPLSVATIGMYMRNLRAIYNQAIQDRIISRDTYPFGKHGYKIPTKTGRKIAVQKDQRIKLINHIDSDAQRAMALDFWKFSYYCYGINFADIAHLRRSNIQGDNIVIYRQKTKNTERDKKELSIHIRDEVRDIINRRGVKSLDPNAYIFDILKAGETERQNKSRIHDFIKDTNSQLKAIAGSLGITVNLTTYTARHTFATTLRDAGVATNFIQKLMDHQSEKTTEIYFDGLDKEEKIKIASMY